MNRLQAALRDNLRIVITIAALIVLLIVWQFGWMSPEAGKINADHAAAATDQTTLDGLRLELAELVRESHEVQRELPYLKRFPTEIPPAPQYGVLVDEIQALEEATNVDVNPLSVSKVPPAASGITAIPVSIQVSGGHDQLIQFLDGLTGTGRHRIKRLVTVQSFDLQGPGPNVLSSSEAQYSASIAATAYTTAVAAPAGATT
ncbi:MAG TPA: hypothetical protein VMD59_18190 [Acidimicrobiales bacterium]|nr:hypothetical protein [Acidimicrobiales bacterium]